MEGLEQQKIISSGSKGRKGRYNLNTPPPADHISQKPEMVGQRFGWVEIISPEKRWTKGWNKPMVLTKCTGCAYIQWAYLENLQRGKSKGCQQCSKPRQIPAWLDRRLTAAKQRCENPSDK